MAQVHIETISRGKEITVIDNWKELTNGRSGIDLSAYLSQRLDAQCYNYGRVLALGGIYSGDQISELIGNYKNK